MRKTIHVVIAALAVLGLAAGTAQAEDSVWVNSFCCAPGETVTVQIHGTVDDPSASVEWKFENAASGTIANTPVGSTDDMDVGFVGGTGMPRVYDSGRFWDSIKVTCPPDACPGNAAVYRLSLRVNGALRDSDVGCVTVWGSKGKGVYAPVEPGKSHVHVPVPGTTQKVTYTVSNTDDQAHQFAFVANTLNHLTPGENLFAIMPLGGVASYTFIDEFTIEGVLLPMEPGESIVVELMVDTIPGLGQGTGNTVNLTVIDEETGAALNGSSAVFVSEEPPVEVIPIK